MSTPMDNPQPVEPAVEVAQPPARKRFFARRGVLISLIAIFIILVGAGGYAFFVLRSHSCTPAKSDKGPTCVPLPANTTFVEMKDDQTWLYTVDQTTVDVVIAFYQDQLSANGWVCFGTTDITNVEINGVTLSGKITLAGASQGNYDLGIAAATGDIAQSLYIPAPADGITLQLSLTPRSSGAANASSCGSSSS